jgi:predicted RNA-binding protein with TRAM domain
MYGKRVQRFAPVKVGDEIDVKIEAIGEKGDGIAKKDGFVLVIPGTNKDDEVKVKITKVLRRVGFAEVVGKSDGLKAPEKKIRDTEDEEEVEEETEESGEQESGEEYSEPEEEEFNEDSDSEDFGGDLEE